MKLGILFLFSFLFLLDFTGHAQVNSMGKPGYITTPSAEWFPDKSVGFSFAYIPGEYTADILGSGETPAGINQMNLYSLRAQVLSFVELDLTIANRPQMKERIGVGDRQLDLRFHLFREKKYLPSIVLGWTPPGSVSPVLAHDYLVITKNIFTRLGSFQVSLGYGSPYIIMRENNSEDNIWRSLQVKRKKDFLNSRYLSGFFGGFSWMPVEFGGLMLEYNTQTWNTGVFVKIMDRFYIQAYNFEGKEWGLSGALQFPLNFAPKALRQYEKSLD